MPPAIVVKVWFTTVVLAALLGALWYASTPPVAPYLMVDELVRAGLASHLGHDLRLHGWVVDGSAHARGPGYSFVLQKNGQRLRIFADGSLPAVVTRQAELVITGHLVADDTPGAEQPYALAATDLNLRCARNYRQDAPAFQ